MSWRTPMMVLACGSTIMTRSLGIRHGFGLYLLSVVATLVNQPIDERPLGRQAAAA